MFQVIENTAKKNNLKYNMTEIETAGKADDIFDSIPKSKRILMILKDKKDNLIWVPVFPKSFGFSELFIK